MPSDQAFADLFTYVLELTAAQNVILRLLEQSNSGFDRTQVDRDIFEEIQRLQRIREVSDLRSTRDSDLLVKALIAIESRQWKR
jgi:hypothetical protein